MRHGMQTRSSDENSVCLSVCQTHDLWQNERKLCPHSYTTWKTIYPSFVTRRMVGVGATPFTWNFGSNWPHWSKIADFQSIFPRSASAITPSQISSINTNRKSTTCFPISLRWTSYVAPMPPKGGFKTQNGCFPCKITLRLKKVCYKVSLCENCQQQSCKAFIHYLSVYK